MITICGVYKLIKGLFEFILVINVWKNIEDINCPIISRPAVKNEIHVVIRSEFGCIAWENAPHFGQPATQI